MGSRESRLLSKSSGYYSRLALRYHSGKYIQTAAGKSSLELLALDFPGYAIGGLSVGESFEVFRDILSYTSRFIPDTKPRYLMGVGTPEYILEACENGIDLFDCVFPTRIARNACAFTKSGTLSLRLERNTLDTEPIDPTCECPTCRHHSKSYIRHLFKAKEITAAVLTTVHNLYFIQNLILSIRNAIRKSEFSAFKRSFLASYVSKKK